MGRPHHLVVAPAISVEVVGSATADLVQSSQIVGHHAFGEVPPGAHQRLAQPTVQADLLAVLVLVRTIPSTHAGSSLVAPRCAWWVAVLAVLLTMVRVSSKVKAAVTESRANPIP